MRVIATDVMEIIGGLLVIAAAAVWASAVGLPLALAVAGLGCIAFSWMLTNPAALPAAIAGLVARVRALAARSAARRAAARQSDGRAGVAA